ncbi:MAG: hypothetical protein R3F48_14450 [Candidatus Zixiibacteriota bacterium]
MGNRLLYAGGIIIIGLLAVFAVNCGGDKSANSSGTIQTGNTGELLLIDHTSADEFSQIPDSVIRDCKIVFDVFHGRTAYGGQITSGMNMLFQEDTLYQYRFNGLYYVEFQDDLGTLGDTSWTFMTRMGLDNPLNTINVILWSWGDGLASNTEQGVDQYLQTLSGLELEYPQVKFVYMTGQVDGTGDAGNTRARNDQIRTYCTENAKILFDVADIESYNPDGDYFADASSACEWCVDWCSTHECPECLLCYESECLNCYRQGQAFWWMLARFAGWNP